MKRRTSLVSILMFLSTWPAMLAQDIKSQPSPVLPSDILGLQLIAWSQMQKPQPIPQPMPSPGRPSQQAEQQPPPQPPSPAAQTFTGTIVKDSGRYILKASVTNVYELDDQERAKQYEGKQVRIAGTLDATGNSLHVTSIELLS
jgi:hypothetical protein